MDIIIIISLVLLAASFAAGRALHNSTRLIKGVFPGYKMALICLVFMAVLLVLAEAILQRAAGESFFALFSSSPHIPLDFFLLGVLQGTVYEYAGCVSLDLWYYPAVALRRQLFLVLPLAYGLFIFIMEDTFAILRHFRFSTFWALVVTAAIQMALIEGINSYTRSWVYKGPFKSIAVLFAGWLLLTYTFVVAMNAFILNPFGV